MTPEHLHSERVISEKQSQGQPARIWSVLLDNDSRSLIGRVVVALLLYVVAVLGREALHEFMPGHAVRYLTFFPALLTAGLVCGIIPSIALVIAFSITGFFWIEATEPAASNSLEFALTLIFAFAGTGVILPAIYSVNAYRRLVQQDEYLRIINSELRHRFKNLLSIVSSICTSSLKHGRSSSTAEISQKITDRIGAMARAQDFLSAASAQGSKVADLVQAVVRPLCPDFNRIQIKGGEIAVPADLATYFALVLHELSTNAIKYGAWRADCVGTVQIAWGTYRAIALVYVARTRHSNFGAPGMRRFRDKAVSIQCRRLEYRSQALSGRLRFQAYGQIYRIN